jgi:prephenate dehydratase
MTATSTALAPQPGTDTRTAESTDLPRVAFQGELGAYGDQAIHQCWRGAATALPSVSFEQVVADVTRGAADYGVLPVWNTVVGDVVAGCAAVRAARNAPHLLTVLGDVHVVVRHQLLGVQGSSIDEIRSVASHPVALAQCGRFFERYQHMLPNPVYDTAGAARNLALSGARDAAAIAGRLAAKRYGLSILHEDIQDVPDNVTQFLVLGKVTSRGLRSSGIPQRELPRW